MKLLFVLSDCDARMIFLQTTSGITRRAVEIELTPEQMEKLTLEKIGVNCGHDVHETVESVSILAEPAALAIPDGE
jgi:hypothetical protein